MCYRVSQKNPTDLPAYYKAPLAEDVVIKEIYYHANGFAHPQLLTISQRDGQLQSEQMQWGLMPSWNKPLTDMLKLSNNTLNAKSETIFELASFKGSINKFRCVLPVDGFYEYKEVGKVKLPYFIHPKEQPYFNLACLYAFYKNPLNKEWIKSFAIITAPANELMADIHNTKFRQPVIISDEQVNAWLNPNTQKDELIHLMQPCDDSRMAAYRVSRDLIKIGNEPEAILQAD